MYRAVLDTCALVPGRQRDFLLQLAAEHAYAPLWGTGILFELDYVLARLDAKRGRPDRAVYRQRLFEQMAKAFPGAKVEAPKDRTYHYELADLDDAHVVYAAIVGKADVIVTDDSRAGFATAPDLVEAQIQIVSPVQFAANTVAAHPSAGLRALSEMSGRTRTPPLTPGQLLDDLRDRYGMTEVAKILGPLSA
ncbi:PIN domain-containing protein [Jatrophihabitans sp. DSM 45814]